MTEAPHLSNEPPQSEASNGDWADRMEQTVLDAAIHHAPATGWNARMLRAACKENALSVGDEIEQWKALAPKADARLHLYGKAEAVRRARKLARKRAQREGLLPAPGTRGFGAGPARG